MSIIEQAKEFYQTNDKYAKTNSIEMFDKCVEIYKENYLSPVAEVDVSEIGNWLSLDLLRGNKEFSLLEGAMKTDDKIKLYFANNALTRKIRENYVDNLADNRSVCKDIPIASIKEFEDKEIERLRDLIKERDKEIERLKEIEFEKNAFVKVFKQLQDDNKEFKTQNEILKQTIKEFQDDIRNLQEKNISEYDVIDEFNLDFYTGSLFIDILKLSKSEVRELYNYLQKIKGAVK
jgi:hypothetical protein